MLTTYTHARRRRRSGTAGLSLPELLMGTAAGLAVAAAAASVTGAQLAATQRIHLALEVDQQLRTGAELVARDLRRSAFWWHAGQDASPGTPNPYAGWQLLGSGGAPGATGLEVARAHPSRTEDDWLGADETHGFRLRGGVLEIQLGRGNWQAVTDPRRLRVTQLVLRALEEPACPAGLAVRSLQIELQAHAVVDPSVQRRWRSWVRLRNEVPAACGSEPWALGTNP